MKKKCKNKAEFSKIILISVGSITLLVTIFTLAVIWKTGDTYPLTYLIPAIFTELATATGFYYSKAKTENQIKLHKLYGSELCSDTKEI